MKTEKRFLETAKKYIPDLTLEQEILVRKFANCKKINNDNFLDRIKCSCSICLRVKMWEMKEENDKMRKWGMPIKNVYGIKLL